MCCIAPIHARTGSTDPMALLWADDEWQLLGRDGQVLQFQVQHVGDGFQVCAGYPGAPLMYSDVYPDMSGARRMMALWWEAAIKRGEFKPLPRDVATARDRSDAHVASDASARN